MICPTCDGKHFVREDYLVLPYEVRGVVAAVVLCPDCGGHGRIHCCEGGRPDLVPSKDQPEE